ncbi:MAG: nickel-responsive transcriptional regulator NikR [Elusimicrobia bacterium]|nr:nickel-responsive transcriptional regulator NikR [Elusimicrobiota bacterium]
MGKLVRTSLAIEEDLTERLDALLKESRCANRSEFIRDLVRNELVRKEWAKDEEALGTVTIVYAHDKRELSRKLVSLQHHHVAVVLASTHVHLDHDLCAEMIMVRGKAAAIQQLADLLRAQKGVLHAALSMSTTGKKMASSHRAHRHRGLHAHP